MLVLFPSPPPPSMTWPRRYHRYLAFLFRYPACGFLSIYWYVLAIRRVYRFLFGEFFRPFDFVFRAWVSYVRALFAISGVCIFVFLLAWISQFACPGGSAAHFSRWSVYRQSGDGGREIFSPWEGKFFSLNYESYRQEGEMLCAFLFLRACLFPLPVSVALRNALRETFSGSNFGFQAFVSGHCFFVLFCLGFSLCGLTFLPKAVWKILFLSGAHFGKFFGSEFLHFLPLCPVVVFWCCFANVFALFSGIVLPKVAWRDFFLLRRAFRRTFSGANFGFQAFCVRSLFFFVLFCLGFSWLCGLIFLPKAVWKILFLSGARFGNILGSELLVFLAFVSSWFFLMLFCQCFCFILWHCSPKSCLKRFFPSQARISQKIFGSELWFLAFVSGRCCFGVFCLCFFFIMQNCS